MNAIESLCPRILFAQAGWTTFHVASAEVAGEEVSISIPVTYSEEPLPSDPRLVQRILRLSGTSNSDVLKLETTKTLIQDAPGENHVAFELDGPVGAAARDDSREKPEDDNPEQWRFWLDVWFDLYSQNNDQPVITGTYLNTRFYIPWSTDRILADTGAGNDVIDIDPAIKSKTMIAGGRGDDIILSGGGYAYISGGDGADKLYARGSSSDLFGNANSDQLVGGKGIDRLYGGGGNDRLSGGPVSTNSVGLQAASSTDDLLVGGRGIDRATQDDRDLFQSIESFF
jgi:Ca2+-binding RTX toxin-like protein